MKKKCSQSSISLVTLSFLFFFLITTLSFSSLVVCQNTMSHWDDTSNGYGYGNGNGDGNDNNISHPIVSILPFACSTRRFLLQKRSKHAIDEPFTYHMVSGYIDLIRDSRCPIRAARRKLVEETGFEGGISLRHMLYDGVYNVYVYIGIVPEEFRTQCRVDSEEHRWVTLKELNRSIEPKHTGLRRFLALNSPFWSEIISPDSWYKG